jgi:hypothetical protein
VIEEGAGSGQILTGNVCTQCAGFPPTAFLSRIQHRVGHRPLPSGQVPSDDVGGEDVGDGVLAEDFDAFLTPGNGFIGRAASLPSLDRQGQSPAQNRDPRSCPFLPPLLATPIIFIGRQVH